MRLPRPTSLCSPGCGLSSALSRGSRTRGAKLATSKAPTAAARSPLEGYFATASRRESDPFPQPGLGAYKGTLWDPAAKIAPGQVARNSNLKFGVRPSTLAIKQPMRIKTPTKANINAAPPSSTVRVVPYPVRAVKALGRRYLSRAACEKTADVCGSPRRRLRVVGGILPRWYRR